MKYCKRCVYPQITVNLDFDENGICNSCRSFEQFNKITKKEWDLKKKKIIKIVSELKIQNKNSNYDCVIGVSGGKDSYFQAHIIATELKLKPLLVTYDGNNFLPEGIENRDNMRKVFDADHLIWGPSIEVLKKLNRLGFKKMGDMNWQNHCGIFTVPIKVAVKFNIPFVIWGETPWDISGMYSPEDYVEFSARSRLEHGLRGFDYDSFIGDKSEKITEKDLIWAKYPSDKEILDAGVRGIYVGNYFKWDPNYHVKLVKKKYNWKSAKKPFERTYRNFSNLDDRYENGIHDLLKFIKFGYGRCSDHASKDIRTNYMTREDAIELVKKYDSVVSSDLYFWLDYVKMSEDEFWRIADTFRDPRVWWIENGKWYKHNIWGSPSSYGKVYLNKDQIVNFKTRQKNI